jgi:hypothetical protein
MALCFPPFRRTLPLSLSGLQSHTPEGLNFSSHFTQFLLLQTSALVACVVQMVQDLLLYLTLM